MLPMKAVRLALGELLAADTSTLAPVAANKIALIVNAFALDENLDIGTLSFATFTGGDPKAGASGAQQVGTDPVTGDQVITILAPVGGWRWECTADPTLPETIYGWALINDAEDAILAAAILPAPIAISESGQFIDLGAVNMTFVLAPIN